MNVVLYYVFFAGFVYLPLAVLVVRGFWPQRMPWGRAFLIVAVVGWALAIRPTNRPHIRPPAVSIWLNVGWKRPD